MHCKDKFALDTVLNEKKLSLKRKKRACQFQNKKPLSPVSEDDEKSLESSRKDFLPQQDFHSKTSPHCATPISCGPHFSSFHMNKLSFRPNIKPEVTNMESHTTLLGKPIQLAMKPRRTFRYK